MNLDWIAILGIFGTLISVVGLIYAWIVARRSDRKKIFTYDVTSPLPLASVLPNRIEHRLSIVYEREGADPVNVQGAYLRFIKIGNLGKEPIRREDIASSDPLRIVIRGPKVLDIATASVSRDVINFKIDRYEESEMLNDLHPTRFKELVTVSTISFDFLDYQDGAIIKILTDKRRASIGVVGTIIGMPEGIHSFDDINKRPYLGKIGVILFLVTELACISGALYFIYLFVGTWKYLWFVLLLLGAFFIPAGVAAIVNATIWPKGRQWPKTLILPHWFTMRTRPQPDFLIEEYREEWLDRMEHEQLERRFPEITEGGSTSIKPTDTQQ